MFGVDRPHGTLQGLASIAEINLGVRARHLRDCLGIQGVVVDPQPEGCRHVTESPSERPLATR